MKVFTITAMYPTRKDHTYGIYVRDTVEALKRTRGIGLFVVGSVTTGRGVLALLKYTDVGIRSVYCTLTRDFDCVHAHYVIPAGLIALVPKYLRRKRLVVTAHGSDINLMPKKNRLLWYLTRFVLRRADRIIAVSRPLAEKITGEFGIDAENVSVIPCGIDTSLFRPTDREYARDVLGLDRKGTFIFHLSGLDPVKRVDLLIGAFALLKTDAVLIIGGDGPNAPDLKRLVRERGLSDRVKFIGFVDKRDVRLWMNAADVFVLTSMSEGTPVTLIEAMAAGTSIVATDVGGVADVVAGLGELVSDASPENIAGAIERCLVGADAGAKRKRIEKSREYSWDVLAPRIADLYED